jgi:hypothetical protein
MELSWQYPYLQRLHNINPLFMEHIFGHRFQLSRKLFLHILDGVRDHGSYFECKTDVAGKIGFTPY